MCDYKIKDYRKYRKLNSMEIRKIHEKGKITFEEKVSEWEKYNICAPDSNLRCSEFNNCHECLTEYASINKEYEKCKIKEL